MFKEINIRDVKENMVSLLGDQWALLTAGNKDEFNTMTVSWGGIGVLWGKDVATVYVRPQRYTYEFLEKHDEFTLSFYDEKFKDSLVFCGSKSGRDFDKAKEAGLSAVFSEKAPYFEEGKLVLVCKKLAKSRFEPKDFIDDTIMSNYAQNDFHYIYYAEIEKVLICD